ncbi:lysylphosphatidylglycerol synthase transmembrane domain-containing protein [Spirochaeta lutea]|uniref:Flippase-like domain-containing protein n=1 Tax=Spirochaeta lutea TaxID=1480694 RepID=A0A098QYT1_9SPIO|nr:lysylphosphatidylglycerol synthase transmembrane domain-containing protein [Spirochaeta lutea]KGE71652.1 hypothetical protein DC28_10315 [Spirochaeta lutea]
MNDKTQPDPQEEPIKAAAEPESDYKPQSAKKLARGIALALLFGILVNGLIGIFLDGEKLLSSVSQVSPWIIIVPFACQFGLILINALRTVLIGRHFSQRISPADSFINSMLGVFFNALTPMAAGGQPFQIYHLQRHGFEAKTATNIIFSRFVVNAMALLTVLLFSIPKIIQIAGSVTIGAFVFYLGLIVTFSFAIFFLIVLINPTIIGRISLKLRHNRLGTWIGKISKKPNWSLSLMKWTHSLRTEIQFLWSEKLSTMITDVFLNFLVIFLEGLAVFYPVYMLAGQSIGLLDSIVTFIIVWQVVFYIPTPGASGTIEGFFALVFAGLTGLPEQTLIAVISWRIGTYYLIILLGLLTTFWYLKRDHVSLPKNGHENTNPQTPTP